MCHLDFILSHRYPHGWPQLFKNEHKAECDFENVNQQTLTQLGKISFHLNTSYNRCVISRSTLSGENSKCWVAWDNFLFVCPSFTSPFTVSAVKCQLYMTCPQGPHMPFRECSEHLLTSFWVDGETSDNTHVLGETLWAVILGRADSCHTKQLCHACQTPKKVQTLGSLLDKCLSVLGNITCPVFLWMFKAPCVSQWLISREQPSSGQIFLLSYPCRWRQGSNWFRQTNRGWKQR